MSRAGRSLLVFGCYVLAVGAFLLVAVTDIISTRLRKTDAVAQWGGEEFLVLLPDADVDGSSQVAEGLRQAVESHRTRFRDQEIGVSITVGIVVGGSEDSLADVIARADGALYRGKEAGRNRVVAT